MTKPSYEELEPSERWIIQNWYRVVPSAENRHGFTTEEVAKLIHERVHELETSLARVRGLLQRLEWAGSNVGCPVCPICNEYQKPDGKHFSGCLMEEAISGAESADIGKLDSADKKYLHAQAWLCPEGYSSPRLRPWMVGVNFTDLIALLNEYGAYVAGSAETGGEKADCEHENAFVRHGSGYYQCPDCEAKIPVALPACTATTHTDDCRKTGECDCLDDYVTGAKEAPATVPRSPQNHTVSSGVEGAHEGTAADKTESKAAPDPLDYFLVTYGFDGNNHARQMLISCWAVARQYERKQAAESSLSSPPPKENE